MLGRLASEVTFALAVHVSKMLGSFTRVSSAMKTALEGTLTRSLTPKRSINVLREESQLCAQQGMKLEAWFEHYRAAPAWHQGTCICLA